MAEKKTMTINLSDIEMEALEELCKRKDLSKTAIMRQALRLYQLVDDRLAGGERLYFEHDLTKEKAQFVVL